MAEKKKGSPLLGFLVLLVLGACVYSCAAGLGGPEASRNRLRRAGIGDSIMSAYCAEGPLKVCAQDALAFCAQLADNSRHDLR